MQCDDPVNIFTLSISLWKFTGHPFYILSSCYLNIEHVFSRKIIKFSILMFTNKISSAYFSWLINVKFPFLLCIHSGVNVATVRTWSQNITTGLFRLILWHDILVFQKHVNIIICIIKFMTIISWLLYAKSITVCKFTYKYGRKYFFYLLKVYILMLNSNVFSN